MVRTFPGFGQLRWGTLFLRYYYITFQAKSQDEKGEKGEKNRRTMR